jgi:hypothetical protein
MYLRLPYEVWDGRIGPSYHAGHLSGQLNSAIASVFRLKNANRIDILKNGAYGTGRPWLKRAGEQKISAVAGSRNRGFITLYNGVVIFQSNEKKV